MQHGMDGPQNGVNVNAWLGTGHDEEGKPQHATSQVERLNAQIENSRDRIIQD